MGTLASGSIDLKSLKVAGEGASKYITEINEGGIKIHDSQRKDLDYLQLTSKGVSIYQNGQSDNNKVAFFGEEVVIGPESLGHLTIKTDGISGFDDSGNRIMNLSYDETSEIIHVYKLTDLDENNTDLLIANSNIPEEGNLEFILTILETDDGPEDQPPEYHFNIPYQLNQSISKNGTIIYDSLPVGYGYRGQVSDSEAYKQLYGEDRAIDFVFTLEIHGSALEITKYSLSVKYPLLTNIAPHYTFGIHENVLYGNHSFSEGYMTQALGNYSHAGGNGTIAVADYQTVFGKFNEEDNSALFVIGNGSDNTNRSNLMTIGDNLIRIGNLGQSHLLMDYHSLQLIDKEGNKYFHVSDLRESDGTATLTEYFRGNGTQQQFTVQFPVDSEIYAIASQEPDNTAERNGSDYTFNEPPQFGHNVIISYKTKSSLIKAYTFGIRHSSNLGAFSVVEGYLNDASGAYSHAEGTLTYAGGVYSHAEGYGTTASGQGSHAEGNATTASGRYSHSQNFGTIAQRKSQTVLGEYNMADTGGTDETTRGNYAVIVGKGTSDTARSNALTVDWSGNVMSQGMAGQVIMYAGSIAPTGWLLCDGSAVSRITYATLFAVIGTTYGAGDGSTTFNLPDFRDRFAVGAGSTYSNNSKGGYKDAAVISHTHSISSSGGHTHTVTARYDQDIKVESGGGTRYKATGDSTSTSMATIANDTGKHTHSVPAPSGSVAGTNRNLPPYIGINFIIATGKTY